MSLSFSCCLCLYCYHAPNWEARFACTELVETCTRAFACGACAPCACTSPFQGAFRVHPGRAPGSCTGHSGPSGPSAGTGLGPRRSCLRSVTNRFFSRVGSEVPHFPENSECDWGRGTATRVGSAVGGRWCLALRPGLWSPRLNSAPDGFQSPPELESRSRLDVRPVPTRQPSGRAGLWGDASRTLRSRHPGPPCLLVPLSSPLPAGLKRAGRRRGAQLCEARPLLAGLGARPWAQRHPRWRGSAGLQRRVGAERSRGTPGAVSHLLVGLAAPSPNVLAGVGAEVRLPGWRCPAASPVALLPSHFAVCPLVVPGPLSSPQGWARCS